MPIPPFNTLTYPEYQYYIENHKRFGDFNTLGLYRSLGENVLLTLEEKIGVRELAHGHFARAFEFLQLKDPWTYVMVRTLGLELTKGDEDGLWDEIRRNQARILRDKKLRHQNFGVYSKHSCGREDCPLEGLMVKQGQWPAWHQMSIGNVSRYEQREKSNRRRIDRKNEGGITWKELDLE